MADSFDLPENSFIELRFTVAGSAYLDTQKKLKMFLMNQGIRGENVVFENSPNLKAVMCYFSSHLEASQIQEKFSQTSSEFNNVDLKDRVLGVSDWRDKWKEDYHIVDFGERFSVVPVWEKEQFAGNRIPIFLEPGSAFGSGCHETTRIMVELMESVEGEFDDFLDIGTGTGILSVAGSYLGAKRIHAFDRDKPSVEFARSNFVFNQREGATFKCQELGKVKIGQTYEFVGANVLSKILIRYQRVIQDFVAPGKYLAISGIHSENVQSFMNDFKTDSLHLLKKKELNGWYGALYQRNK